MSRQVTLSLRYIGQNYQYKFMIHVKDVSYKKVPVNLKDKVYKTVIKPTMTHGAEWWTVRKKDENRLHVAEMRMLRW